LRRQSFAEQYAVQCVGHGNCNFAVWAHSQIAALTLCKNFHRPPSAKQESQMKKSLLLSLVLTPMLLLGAWPTLGAAAQDNGQRISQRGDQIGDYGSEWSDGKKEAVKGQRLIDNSAKKAADAEKKMTRARDAMAKAEDQLQQAQNDRNKGEQLVARGTEKMEEAEAKYAAVRAGPSAVTDGRGN
jgi:hypothetical protein